MKKPKAWAQGCPNAAYSHYRLLSRGNIKSVATHMTQSGKRRLFACKTCGERFSGTRDTVFYDLRTAEERVIIVLKLLLCRGVRCRLSWTSCGVLCCERRPKKPG